MHTRAAVRAGILALGAVVVLAGCSSSGDAVSDEDPLTFATVPLVDDPTAVNPVEELVALMSEETGREVEVTDVPDYLAVVEAVRNGHVDFGLMSGFPSALAVNTGEVDALLAWPGRDEPVSTCIVLDQSPLQTFDDITAETVVAFADPASSSGYFMPVYMLDEAGLKKDVDYTSMFSGGHDMSFLALQEGEVDVACTSPTLTSMYESALFPFAQGETRSIGESGTMPISTAFLAGEQLSEERRTILIDAIPNVFVEENAERLGVYYQGAQGVEMIVEPGAEMFQPFVDMAAVAGVELSDLK